jgi:hypothetical protein
MLEFDVPASVSSMPGARARVKVAHLLGRYSDAERGCEGRVRLGQRHWAHREHALEDALLLGRRAPPGHDHDQLEGVTLINLKLALMVS